MPVFDPGMKRFAAILVFLPVARGAELRQETIRAWEEYVQAANAQMHERLDPEHAFLRADEIPGRIGQLRSGVVVAEPNEGPRATRVRSGLIHYWKGAAFIANAGLDDVSKVVRDRDHYNEFYRPGVLASRSVEKNGAGDRFSVLLMNKAVLARTALEVDSQSTYFPVDARRLYSVSFTSRIQQIDGYGSATEHKLPPDQGNGYIWRMYSITRFEERDGGVYFEVEAMTLSRDIPFALRWLVEPMVRRFSKNTLCDVTATNAESSRRSGCLESRACSDQWASNCG